MPNISTLVTDIYKVLEGGVEPSWFPKVDITDHLVGMLKPRSYQRAPKTLRFSEIGAQCLRQLHYKVNSPDLAEKHRGQTLLKFYYGHALETTLLALTEAAGHTVEGRQEKAHIDLSDGWQVKGSADAFIDGILVDVKSVTKQSENKFKDGLTDTSDIFGYRLQLGGYAVAFDRTEAGFFTIGKELGNLGYYPISVDKGWVLDRMERAADAVKGSLDALPRIDPVPEGKSGNTKLCTTCSYCAFKEHCYPEARMFNYSKGPVWLVDVKRQPKVEEEIL